MSDSISKIKLLGVTPEINYGVDAAAGPDQTDVMALPRSLAKSASFGLRYAMPGTAFHKKYFGMNFEEISREMDHERNKPKLEIFTELGTINDL